ncbi:MAG: hypothetical protein D6756_10950, partial [Cyanobacteria bacterium J083]
MGNFLLKGLFSKSIFWLSLSLAFALLCSLPLIKYGFSYKYLVTSDAQQFTFWMARFADPDLFPADMIADYFQSVTPWGYATLYRLFASWGLEPLTLSKFLPPVLGLVTTAFCFGICLELLPIPLAGFIATVILNQTLWMEARLADSVPRSFVYPLLLAFFFSLLRHTWIGMALAILLLGLFYPQGVLVCVAILGLRLLEWRGIVPYFSINKRNYWDFVGILALSFLIMTPYALKSSVYEPIISLAQAKTLPEFSASGRTQFFGVNPWEFWLYGKRSGMFALMSPWCIFALFLPRLKLASKKFPLTQKLRPQISILWQILLGASIMFFLAHLLLFRLHLPNRYIEPSLLIITAIAAGISLTLIIEWFLRQAWLVWLGVRGKIAVSLMIIVWLFPLSLITVGNEFPDNPYKRGRVPELYDFFAQQPKDTLIASLASRSDKIPPFSHRSILVGRKYAIPYHLGYYLPFRQR